MNLGIDDIVPEALHGKVGWDMRHHFMAEKVVDRFGLWRERRPSALPFGGSALPRCLVPPFAVRCFVRGMGR
jgi:hypothetical protein